MRTFRDRDDRTVHGRSHSGDYEIVRYDRTGKWYFEADDGSRVHVSVSHAAQVAAVGTFHPGRVGGRIFDKRVRDKRAELSRPLQSFTLEAAVVANKKLVELQLPAGAIELLYDVLGHFPHDPDSWSNEARALCAVALMDARTAE